MTRLRLHSKTHLVSRIGWLRAVVLSANDRIVSTATLAGRFAASAAATEISAFATPDLRDRVGSAITASLAPHVKIST
ncbi:MAG: hypothetical protein Q8P60_15015 [Pseudorhodobacter sp.]|nr:hypothetical protein [Pseudorhodobacter sp.]